MEKHEVIKVKDSTLPNDEHKCSACCGTQDCICNLDYQEREGLGNCMEENHHYKEVK